MTRAAKEAKIIRALRDTSMRRFYPCPYGAPHHYVMKGTEPTIGKNLARTFTLMEQITPATAHDRKAVKEKGPRWTIQWWTREGVKGPVSSAYASEIEQYSYMAPRQQVGSKWLAITGKPEGVELLEIDQDDDGIMYLTKGGHILTEGDGQWLAWLYPWRKR